MPDTNFISSTIRNEVEYVKIQKYQRLAGKIHLYFLYSITMPSFIFIVAGIFGSPIVTAVSFYSLGVIALLYISFIKFFNFKVERFKRKIK
jgi:hypothetical protein